MVSFDGWQLNQPSVARESGANESFYLIRFGVDGYFVEIDGGSLADTAIHHTLHPIVREELELLDGVTGGLETVGERGPESESSVIQELEHIREQLLRGKLDFYERSALSSRWTVQSTLLRHLQESRAAPRVDPVSPYFAHLRMVEDGRVRDVCIGRATCLDSGIRIVDWRHAPIASLFYRYRQGEEYEEEINGRVRRGSILARRTVTIRDGALRRIDAPEGSFVESSDALTGWQHSTVEAPRLAGGEGITLRVYRVGEGQGRRFGGDLREPHKRLNRHLPDIASLIDPEQFALIAKPSTGYVAIRGVAGSGKTTVALHRIAYLAYEEPSFDSANTLFLVFSPALRDYVKHLLPALGVFKVSILTYRDWATRQRQRIFPELPRSDGENAPAVVQRLKLHPALGAAQELHAKEVPGPATASQVLDDWNSVLCDVELLRKCFMKLAPGAFSNKQLGVACDWSRRRNEELTDWLAGDRENRANLDVEDDCLLLRAWQLRVGPLPNQRGNSLRYRHVAIDEVQDFSPNEVRVLLDCLDSRKSLTLAGDIQQHIVQDSGFTSWDEFFSQLGVSGTQIHTLKVSYRSSREITNFALHLLGDEQESDPSIHTTRSGPAVELFQFTDPGACAAFLGEVLEELGRSEPLASVAILTPDPETSALYYEGLEHSDLPKLHLVTHHNFRFGPGVEITEIEQTKGLEFDYVVVVNVDKERFPDNAPNRRLLHVAATRAIHQLWFTSIGPPSPVVKRAADMNTIT